MANIEAKEKLVFRKDGALEVEQEHACQFQFLRVFLEFGIGPNSGLGVIDLFADLEAVVSNGAPRLRDFQTEVYGTVKDLSLRLSQVS